MGGAPTLRTHELTKYSTRLLSLGPPPPHANNVRSKSTKDLLAGWLLGVMSVILSPEPFSVAVPGDDPRAHLWGPWGRMIFPARENLHQLVMLHAYTSPDTGGIRHHVRRAR